MTIDSHQNQQQKLDLHEMGPVSRVEAYKFEPIRGYPMLHWTGKHPFMSTEYYPAQHKETYGPEVNGWRNKLYWGDNLQVMSHLLKEYRGKIKLVYIDPPFDSKADYKRRISLKGSDVATDLTAFEEKQYADIWTNDSYLQFIYERIILLRELMADDGSVFVHCDYRKIHHIRCILDEIFGADQFQNEIIWSYIIGASGSGRFGRKHQTILYYTKGGERTFNREAIGVPYNPETLARARRGEARYNVSPEELEEKGKNPGDVWADVTPIQGNSRENRGYPTQKPEALLNRIVKAASNEGDIILDCFMGSGTTQTVAMKLGRRFIGADINLGAIQTTTKCLLEDAAEITVHTHKLLPDEDQPARYYTGFEVYNVNNYDIFRNPIQAKELLIQALEVNPLQPGGLFDGERDGRMWKVMPVNRIATRQDLTELIMGMDYKTFQRRQEEHPNQPVEKITLVCMGHEPDLAALFQQAVPFKLDVEVVDILRDRQDLQFKRDSEARIVISNGELVIEQFFPMNLLHKLSLQKEYVADWRELVDSIMVDWNYDGAVLQPAVIDVPERNELVKGRYRVPEDAGTIRVKITDLLSESLEMELPNGQ